MLKNDIKIVLETGHVLEGQSFGKRKDVVGDFIFNTSIAGYQEVLTDPSYHNEIVVMTFPVQGIYGINDKDDESVSSNPAGFVVSSFEEKYSNNHATESINSFLERKSIQGIAGIDTRYLTKIIRENGSSKGAIVAIEEDTTKVLEKLRTHRLSGHVPEVSPKNISIKNKGGDRTAVMFDFGAKDSIEKHMISKGYKVIRVPYKTSFEEVKDMNPDLVLLSNGPGDPSELNDVVQEVKKMINHNMKICGICLGHQIIGLALGAKTERLKFGHHSMNHPVINIENNKVYITSQNHNYAVTENSLPTEVAPFLKSLHDGTVAGIRHNKKPVISVQFHPEAAPGPSDANELFDEFIKYLEGGYNA